MYCFADLSLTISDSDDVSDRNPERHAIWKSPSIGRKHASTSNENYVSKKRTDKKSVASKSAAHIPSNKSPDSISSARKKVTPGQERFDRVRHLMDLPVYDNIPGSVLVSDNTARAAKNLPKKNYPKKGHKRTAYLNTKKTKVNAALSPILEVTENELNSEENCRGETQILISPINYVAHINVKDFDYSLDNAQIFVQAF